MPGSARFSLPYTGSFDLALSLRIAGRAAFVDGVASDSEGAVRVALMVEGEWAPVLVQVRQAGDGEVLAEVLDNPSAVIPEMIQKQVGRMFGLDVAADDFDRLAGAAGLPDLVHRFTGLRPVQFPSPYEAAARAIIGHRLAVRQAAAVTARVAEEHGTCLQADGGIAFAFPRPSLLAELGPVRGLSARKVEQLRGLGAAVAAGGFDAAALRGMGREPAMRLLQTLAGIGPFSAELILIRGAGDPDVFPRTEHKLHGAMARRYGVDVADLDALERLAETWRPYRSWVGLMLREA